WQNTRLPYWSMLASGDADLMKPLFNLYFQALELAEKRTRIYFDHAGVFFPETMYFWGAYTMDNYGWPEDRSDLPVNTILNRYIRYEWQGGLELTLMLLDWFDYFGDETFLKQSILPFAEKIITFYDEHYPRTENGTLRIWPGQALETYWDSENPAPEIPGLKTVLSRLLALEQSMVSDDTRKNWQQLQAVLPELPMREVDGKLALGFAGKVGPKHNLENPELYAVWPYGLYGVVLPDLELARETYARRLATATGGWQQNAIQAAVLGLTDEARKMVVSNFTSHAPDSRFPAFWGPNYDWIPDQDNGGVSMIALQKMLLQTVGDQILLFPAWPAEWDVSFKLYAPGETIICGELHDGELVNLQVEPASRKKDVRILLSK
ncbi:hypothetical protein KAH55_14645, partial [bacterium]|nr:hypothetical protein [bacterium]